MVSGLVLKKYKRFASWVDVLAFFLITGITLYYVSIYPLDIRSQLIPIIFLILLGLGYGLIFRIPKLKETLHVQEQDRNDTGRISFKTDVM